MTNPCVRFFLFTLFFSFFPFFLLLMWCHVPDHEWASHSESAKTERDKQRVETYLCRACGGVRENSGFRDSSLISPNQHSGVRNWFHLPRLVDSRPINRVAAAVFVNDTQVKIKT